jgi:hypothetical protein
MMRKDFCNNIGPSRHAVFRRLSVAFGAERTWLEPVDGSTRALMTDAVEKVDQ